MTSLALIATLALARPVRASEFLEALHRADAREAKDPERIEFAARAIQAWRPSDGDELLADAYFRRGEGEFAAFDDAAADADLTKALAHDEHNAAALLLRARARLRAGRLAEAELDFSNETAARRDDGAPTNPRSKRSRKPLGCSTRTIRARRSPKAARTPRPDARSRP
jgi:hypothetical protein